MRSILNLLCVIAVVVAGAGVVFAECKIKITAPVQNSIVSHNNESSEEGSFMFTVEGTVTGLGRNAICIYQKVSSDSNDWWRSGKPITQNTIGPNGEWSSVYVSCGKKNTPHPSCLVKAVVQAKCIASGSTTTEIGESLCSTAAYTYKTTPKMKSKSRAGK